MGSAFLAGEVIGEHSLRENSTKWRIFVAVHRSRSYAHLQLSLQLILISSDGQREGARQARWFSRQNTFEFEHGGNGRIEGQRERLAVSPAFRRRILPPRCCYCGDYIKHWFNPNAGGHLITGLGHLTARSRTRVQL